MSPDLSRRSVAKGAAWAVPAVAIGAPAAQAATSGVTIAWSACNMDCAAPQQVALSGRTAQGSNLFADTGFTAGSTAVPVGTVVSWSISFWVLTTDASAQLAAGQPIPIKDTYGNLSVGAPTAAGTQTYNGEAMTQVTYPVTYTVTQTVPAGGKICTHVVWSGSTSGNQTSMRKNHSFPPVTISPLTATGATVTAGGGYISAAIGPSTGTYSRPSCI